MPTVVITGAWNPAIFSPSWIARNLFGIAKGTRVLVAELQRPNYPIRYIDDLGIAVSPERLEFFISGLDDASLEKCEAVIGHALDVLPHTPLNAFGVNFEFLSDISDELYSLLQTAEKIEEKYKIKQSSHSIIIAYAENVDLTLNRGISEDLIKFNFNYHHVGDDGFIKKEIFSGIIKKHLTASKDIIRTLYGADEFETFTHDFKIIKDGLDE